VPYDEHLAARVRERLGSVDGVVELKMFSGWVRPFDFTGRPLTGWIFVAAEHATQARADPALTSAVLKNRCQFGEILAVRSPHRGSHERCHQLGESGGFPTIPHRHARLTLTKS
jgi:hypothetical protein